MKININLLPKEKKEEFESRKSARFIFKIGSIAVLAIAVFAIFLIACLKILGIYQEIYARQVENFKSNPQYVSVSSTQELLKTYEEKSAILDKNISKSNKIWPFFVELNSLVPQGIEFEQIKIDEKQVHLSGEGTERPAVIELKDKLEQSGFFSKVESPISNFTQEKNVKFEFNLSLEK